MPPRRRCASCCAGSVQRPESDRLEYNAGTAVCLRLSASFPGTARARNQNACPTALGKEAPLWKYFGFTYNSNQEIRKESQDIIAAR